MTIHRISWFAAIALLGGALAGTPASAQQELVYGNWTPPREYQNVHVMPELFKNIEKETNGAIKWKLIAGGALADGKATFSRGQGRPDAGGARHRHLRAEHSAIALHDLLDRRARPQRRGGGDGRGDGGVLPALPVVPGGLQEDQFRSARRLDQLRLSAGLHPAGKVARRSQGQARARHGRQRRADAGRRRSAGRLRR